MCNVFDEGHMRFDFSACGNAERFDAKDKNAYGMMAVDFIVETNDVIYFVEVKDYQNPRSQRVVEDLEMLKDIVRSKGKEHLFVVKMGTKIKDSMLRKYAEGYTFSKKVMFLLLINLDKLGEFERGLLKTKISGYIPTGLNDARFSAFKSINFDLVNAKQLVRYGIGCSNNSNK